MGQKVNPVGIRLGITRDWVSKWYAGKKQFAGQIYTDFQVRQFLRKKQGWGEKKRKGFAVAK